MVATRRGARTGPADEVKTEDASLTLRKKPVRRATASTTAKTAAPAPKTRATRATKATKAAEIVEPEPEQEDGEDELQITEEAPKPATTRATRAKKAETVASEPTRKTRTTKPAPAPLPKRSTRTATAKPAEEPQETQQAPAVSTKPTLVARPARQTRAKTPAAQSPLSPKKITQVSRVRTRGANSTEEEKAKPATKTRAVTGTRQPRTTRKRTVSDENAEVADSKPAAIEGMEDAIAEIPSLPPKVVSPRKMSPQEEQVDEEVDQMSSGETTPMQTPGASFEQPKDYSEDHKDAADPEETDEDNSASDDELCGPKTPMRRVQKTQPKSHKSTLKNAGSNDPDVPLHTPPRRYGAHGATRATPQTQKPFNQPAVSESAMRPMTVARADSRPFVFRKLEDDLAATPKADAPESVLEEHEEEANAQVKEQEEEHEEEMNAEVEEQKEVPTPSGEKEHHSASEEAEAENKGFNLMEDNGAHMEQSGNDPDETIVVDEGEENSHSDVEMEDSPTAQPPVSSYEVEESMVDVDSSVMEPPTPGYELNDDTMDMDPPVASYELDLDGSIIIHSRGGSSDAEEDSEDDEIDQDGFTEFGLKTPRPQTIPWQNIREDTTIPVDFDLHFADVRTPARTGNDFTFGNATNFSDMQLDNTFDFSTLDGPIEGGQARDSTMNLNDFIDMAALAEPTLQSGAFAGMMQGEHPREQQDGSLVDASEITNDTVIVTRDESPMQSPTAPTHEHEQTSHSPMSANTPHLEMFQDSPIQTSTPRMETAAVTNTPSHNSTDVLEEVDDELVPHYALPTLSSRRKSLPALGCQTPVISSRPITSDGHSIARVMRPFDRPSTAMSRRSSVANSSNTPMRLQSGSVRSRSSARGMSGMSSLDTESPLAAKTPAAATQERFPRRTPKDNYNEQPETQSIGEPSRFQTPDRSHVRKFTGETSQPNTVAVPFRFRTPLSTKAQRPATVQRLASQAHQESSVPSAAAAPVATPQERYPRRSERQKHNEHASTVAAPSRFHTPIQGKPKRPATAQKLASQNAPQDETPGRFKAQVAPKATTPQTVTPEARFPRLPSKRAYDELVDAEAVPLPATPQARFPRLPPKQTYDERATTVVGPSRFRSPAHASPRRPATSQKPVNLRKVALKSSAPGGSHTPIKTPLKAAAMTPSQVPMTPHPGAPLRGVLALVEVFTLDGASASAPFISLLQRLGAKTTKSWSERVTHVIFKDGSPTTLQRVRLNNKEVESTGKGFPVHCVNSRWVSDCDATGSRVDEDDDAYAVDVTEVPRGGGRRRKSMEPSALINIGGNIVRDRKSSGRQSIGFSSLGRSSMKADSSSDKKPEEDMQFATPAGLAELRDENYFDDDESELATPDYLSAPDKLLQMTAPVNRVRKLDFKKDEGRKNRRLTSFWEGGE
jgi:hypothetical protein